MKAQLYSLIELKVKIPKERLWEGDKDLDPGKSGIIIEVFEKPREGYEVEFLYPDGYTEAICTLIPDEFDLA